MQDDEIPTAIVGDEISILLTSPEGKYILVADYVQSVLRMGDEIFYQTEHWGLVSDRDVFDINADYDED